MEEVMQRMDDLAEEMLCMRPAFLQVPRFNQPRIGYILDRMDDLAHEMLSTRPLRSRQFPVGFEDMFGSRRFHPLGFEDFATMHRSLHNAMQRFESISQEMLRSMPALMPRASEEMALQQPPQAAAQPESSIEQQQPMETTKESKKPSQEEAGQPSRTAGSEAAAGGA